MAEFNNFALIRLIISIFLFLLQLQTIRQFLIHKDFQFTCFRIMLFTAIFDLVEQFIQGILPVFIYFYDFFACWKWLEKMFGALNQSAYTSLFLLNLMLAINRLFMVIKIYLLYDYGENEPKWENVLNRVLGSAIALYFVTIFALFCTPFFGVRFHDEFFVWTNDMNATWMEAEGMVEMYFFNNAFPISTMLIYLATFVILKWENKNMVENVSAYATRHKSTQRRILLQCAVQFVVFQIPGIYFMTGWDPAKTTMGRTGVVSILMVIICGVNPFIYIAMLPNFRQKFFADFPNICCWKNAAQQNAVAVLNTNSDQK
ncbi:hypothetical protein niasHS_013689 [Heterodera schachtii]|uniref:Uncharacterized protein n=2 Tax=Heterodera TaxID=34509 RepID=A0ABD2IDS8_HETSC